MSWRREIRWNGRDLGWRVGALFVVGSFLFALGSFPAYSQLVDPGVDAATPVDAAPADAAPDAETPDADAAGR